MLLLARHMNGAWVEASDGKLGKLCDILCDDQMWCVRSLVLDGGTWLHRRRVTLPPDIITHKDWPDHRLAVAGLTRQQIVDTPGTETHIPLHETAEQHEEAVTVDWEIFWINTMPHPWQVSDDVHLRSTVEMTGYTLEGTDGPLGHLADFVIDEECWLVRYLAVDTRTWWPGKHVLVVPTRIESIDWLNRVIRLGVTRAMIEESPQYQATSLGEVHELAAGR